MRPSQIQEADLRRMYSRELLNIQEIADHFECAEVSIRRLLKKFAIPVRKAADIRLIERAVKRRSRARICAETVCQLYIHEKLSTKQIAHRLECTQPAIYYILKRKGIATRNLQDSLNLVSAKPSKERRKFYRLKEDFFKTWTPEMAWVLGLIYTDGHLEKCGTKFALTLKDADVLHNVRELLGFTGSLSRPNKSDAWRLTVCRKSLCEDLRALGVFPAKSQTVEWPTAMPREFVRHFLRGCWDGDGCFVANASNLTASLVSGSKAFAIELWAMLHLELDTFRTEKHKCSISVIPAQQRDYRGATWLEQERYVISFASRAAATEFVAYLYRDVPLAHSMRRKRELAENHLGHLEWKAINPWMKPSAAASRLAVFN